MCWLLTRVTASLPCNNVLWRDDGEHTHTHSHLSVARRNTICQTVKTHLNYIWIWIVFKFTVFFFLPLSRRKNCLSQVTMSSCNLSSYFFSLSLFYSTGDWRISSRSSFSLIDTEFKRLISLVTCVMQMKVMVRAYLLRRRGKMFAKETLLRETWARRRVEKVRKKEREKNVHESIWLVWG